MDTQLSNVDGSGTCCDVFASNNHRMDFLLVHNLAKNNYMEGSGSATIK